MPFTTHPYRTSATSTTTLQRARTRHGRQSGILSDSCSVINNNDVEEAVKILRNVIGDQEKNVSAQWFGDYTVYPEQPTVGSPAYPPVVSSSGAVD
jgi:hypothetical protein